MRRLRNFAVLGVPLILILVGIVFYLWASAIAPEKEVIHLLLGITINAKELLTNIASGLFIVGVIGLALQIYEITKFFDERLTNFFSSRHFLSYLTSNRQKDLHEHLTRLIWNVEEIEAGGLYQFINNEVYPYLTRPFRRDYRARVDSKIWEDRGDVIERVTETEYYIENPIRSKADFTIKMETRLKKITDLHKELIEAEFIEIGGERNEEVRFEKIQETEDEAFYSLSLLIKKVRESTHVKIKTKRYIPIDDKNFNLFMTHPTNSFHLDFTFPGDYGFNTGIFAIGATPNCIHKRAHGVTVEYNGWMLPSHGITIQREDTKS